MRPGKRFTSMFLTIELITETCHGARLCFLLIGSRGLVRQRTRKLDIVCLSARPYHTEDPKVDNKHKKVGARCFFLYVSSGEDGKQRTIIHDVGFRGTQTTRRHDLFVGHLCEEKAP